jgi:hypothetical protein
VAGVTWEPTIAKIRADDKAFFIGEGNLILFAGWHGITVTAVTLFQAHPFPPSKPLSHSSLKKKPEG